LRPTVCHSVTDGVLFKVLPFICFPLQLPLQFVVLCNGCSILRIGKRLAFQVFVHGDAQRQQEQAWDLWLDCWTQDAIAAEVGVDQKTVSNWVGNMERVPKFLQPPASRQHFDVWNFPTADNESSYFGKLSSQVVENLLWLYTAPGQVVFDPFAGSGTTIAVAKTMGRRVWASDRKPVFPLLPIHRHDILGVLPAPLLARR